MPWCPDCRYEYVEGVQTCTDCGAQLVEEEPTGKRVEKPKPEEQLYAPSFRPLPVAEGVTTELLMTIYSRAEADEMESLLVERTVPVHREFLTRGNKVIGFELYVAEVDLERATGILEEAGVLTPVDEAFLEQFSEEAAEDAGHMLVDRDDMAAYRKAVAALPKGYPAAADISENAAVELLATVSTTFEADRIEAVVKMEGIPVWRRNLGAGTAVQAVWGGTNLGVELMVPAELLPVAQAALERTGLQPEVDSPAPDDAAGDAERMDDSGYRRGRSIRGWVLILLFGGGAFLVALILWLVQLLTGGL